MKNFAIINTFYNQNSSKEINLVTEVLVSFLMDQGQKATVICGDKNVDKKDPSTQKNTSYSNCTRDIKILRFSSQVNDQNISSRRIQSHLDQIPDQYFKRGANPLSIEDETTLQTSIVYSKKLIQYIEKHKSIYDCFIFIGHEGLVSIESIIPVKDKSILIPLIEKKTKSAYFSRTAFLFFEAKYIIHKNIHQFEISLDLYGPSLAIKSSIAKKEDDNLSLVETLWEVVDSHLPSKIISIPSKNKAIHQVLPSISLGDATSNIAFHIQNYIKNQGYQSEIFVEHINESVRGMCQTFDSSMISKNDGLIYHHAIACNVLKDVILHSGSKALIYHNITPADFFIEYDIRFYGILQKGRDQLPLLAPFFPISLGDSSFNVQELRECGFQNPAVMGIGITPEKWNIESLPSLFDKFYDGGTNILYVSRVSPNKCQHDLIEAFEHYKRLDPNSRLIIVGSFDPSDNYCRRITQIVKDSKVKDSIFIVGKVNEQELYTYYRLGDLFWSMSEHEGFGVPLLEAMWFDIPVLAFSKCAVSETMGNGGILFYDKCDMAKLSALAYTINHDKQIKKAIISNQRSHRTKFLPEKMNSRIDFIIKNLNRSPL